MVDIGYGSSPLLINRPHWQPPPIHFLSVYHLLAHKLMQVLYLIIISTTTVNALWSLPLCWWSMDTKMMPIFVELLSSMTVLVQISFVCVSSVLRLSASVSTSKVYYETQLKVGGQNRQSINRKAFRTWTANKLFKLCVFVKWARAPTRWCKSSWSYQCPEIN